MISSTQAVTLKFIYNLQRRLYCSKSWGITLLLPFFFLAGKAQHKILPLYKGLAPGSENWTWQEAETTKTPMNARVVYNVTQPALLAYFPDAAIANGVSVIIIPGGGLRILMIEKFANTVAKELLKKGITVFILKYRLIRLKTDDPFGEAVAGLRDTARRDTIVSQLARNDLAAALKLIRHHSEDFKIDRNKVGLIGFSAGAVMASNHIYNSDDQPDFAAINSGVMKGVKKASLQADTPPLFIAASTDDPQASVSNSIELYSDWVTARKSAELHLYAKGGHDLSGSPANAWVGHFVNWLKAMDFIK